MSDPASSLQAAMYNRLSTDASLTTLIGANLFDVVPRGISFPYVSFRETSLNRWTTGDMEGFEVTVTLDVRSRDEGLKELQDICDAVRASLTATPLNVTGFHTTLLHVATATLAQARDGPGPSGPHDGESVAGASGVRLRIKSPEQVIISLCVMPGPRSWHPEIE
jgi:hypothetical protein